MVYGLRRSSICALKLAQKRYNCYDDDEISEVILHMAKPKHAGEPGSAPAPADKPATLRDLLRPEVVNRLQAEAEALRAEEARRKEEQRAQAEAARKAEQKRLDNDFEHLLNNSSMDWRKFK
jgi:hypothetical protein